MLVLIGSGEYLPGMRNVDRTLLDSLLDTPKVICLPTAAGGEGTERIEYWSNLGVDYFTQLDVQVEALPVIDKSSANNPHFAAKILDSNYIYFSGGHPRYLYDTLSNSLVWEAITNVYQNGGILCGCSAGAMVMGSKFLSILTLQNGFNLVPGIILPHYDEIPEFFIKFGREILTRKHTLIGIDGSTALVVTNNSRYVLGNGRVTIWSDRQKMVYKNGGF